MDALNRLLKIRNEVQVSIVGIITAELDKFFNENGGRDGEYMCLSNSGFIFSYKSYCYEVNTENIHSTFVKIRNNTLNEEYYCETIDEIKDFLMRYNNNEKEQKI